ncbi:hypothetical protein EIP86_011105 [Pleurotus ostreatoroseus]|nr:hypothetical protein EIP86_006246 [Pleurotus ostreatoroseus]KAF7799863.1 hypothetical protein EIP86_011105 [Pleurotus ostreatoroseus]
METRSSASNVTRVYIPAPRVWQRARRDVPADGAPTAPGGAEAAHGPQTAASAPASPRALYASVARLDDDGPQTAPVVAAAEAATPVEAAAAPAAAPLSTPDAGPPVATPDISPAEAESTPAPTTPKKKQARKKAGRPSRKGKSKARARAPSTPPRQASPPPENAVPEDEDLADVRRAIALSLGLAEATLSATTEPDPEHGPLSPTAGPSRVPLGPVSTNFPRCVSPLTLHGDLDTSLEDAISLLAAAGYDTSGLRAVDRLAFGRTSPTPSSSIDLDSPHQNASPPEVPSDADSASANPHSDTDTASRAEDPDLGNFVPMSPQPPAWRNAPFTLPPRLFRNGVAAQLQITHRVNPPRTQNGVVTNQPQYTATPEEGFPVVHWADVAAPHLGQTVDQALAWEGHEGPKITVLIAGHSPLDGTIHPPLLHLVNLATQEIHAFLGTTTCRLCAPIPQNPVTRLNCEPYAMFARDLSGDEYVLSTATITLFFFRFGFSIPRFLGFITGYTTRDENEVYTIVRAFLDRHLPEIMHIVNDNPLVSQAIVLQPIADRIVSSLRVSFLDVRGPQGVPTPHFRVYLDLPVDNHASFTAIRNIFLQGPWNDSFAGVGRFNVVYGSTCGLCHGSDHPRGLCPFLAVPGWQGPGAAPDNNNPPPPPPPGPGGFGPFNRGSKRRGDSSSYNDRRKFPRFD